MKSLLSRTFSIVLASLAIAISYGQSSYVKTVQKGDYLKAEEKILKALSKDTGDVELNYCVGYLYSQKGFTGYSPMKAYVYTQRSLRYCKLLTNERDLKKLAKILITSETIQSLSDTICIKARDDAFKLNKIASYDNYLRLFPKAPDGITAEITQRRNAEAFRFATDTNTVASYTHFINKYSSAGEVIDAKLKRNNLAYMQAKVQDNILAYKDFVTTYPDATETAHAYDRMYELIYGEAVKINNSDAYKKFVSENPKNKWTEIAQTQFEKCRFAENTKPGDWVSFKNFGFNFPESTMKQTAMDSLYSIAIRNSDTEALTYGIGVFGGKQRTDMLYAYHDIFTADGEKMTLDLFYQKFNEESLKGLKAKDYDLLAMADGLQMQQAYTNAEYMKYDQYIRLAAPREKAFSALKKMLQSDIESKNWKDALNKLLMYKPFFQNKNKKYNEMLAFLEAQ